MSAFDANELADDTFIDGSGPRDPRRVLIQPPAPQLSTIRPGAWPNNALRQLGSCRRVLMLQGPIGPFFRDLGRLLQRKGMEVHKINFTGGDCRYHPSGQWFRGSPTEFSAMLRDTILRTRPDACIVFGQDRPVHQVARQVLKAMGIPLMVFEEGYVRPNFVTLEMDGVNARSSFVWSPFAPDRASDGASGPNELPAAPLFQLPFRQVASLAAQYHALSRVMSPLAPAYRHHRPMAIGPEALAWLKAGWIKTWAPVHARGLMRRLARPDAPPYFLVPLQVHNDSQLQHHSRYDSIAEFIQEVLASFLAHAPQESHLVIKHHPMDRGHRNYRSLIRRLLKDLGDPGAASRVHYVLDGHLPTMLTHARGTVVINSTVGLSSMHHGTPVIALGQALYQHPGLTHMGPLDTFWCAPTPPSPQQFQHLLSALIGQTQLPGTFYWPSRGYGGLLAAIEAALD